MLNSDIKVVVLGASNKPDRYSYKALQMLSENCFTVIPVHPRLEEIDGHKVVSSLDEIRDDIHTLTLYVGPVFVKPLIPKIVALKPGRVILNPGTESAELIEALDVAGIQHIQACTLVMLRTGQFLKSFR